MSDSSAFVLHGFGPNDRSSKVRWLAHELALPLDDRRMRPPAHLQPPYSELNPYGMVPTVQWRGRTHIESTATLHYVAETIAAERGEPGLAVAPGADGRIDYLQWSSLFAETFEAKLVEYYLSKNGVLPAPIAELTESRLRKRLGVLVGELPKSGFLAAGRFTVADIIASYSLRLAISAELLPRDAVWGYLGPLTERPAAQASGFFSALGV